MTTVLELDEIKHLIDTRQLIQEMETGFALYSEGKVNVPPVGFLHFDDPPGDVHIKYGFISGDDYYVLKIASGFYDNPKLGRPAGVCPLYHPRRGWYQPGTVDRHPHGGTGRSCCLCVGQSVAALPATGPVCVHSGNGYELDGFDPLFPVVETGIRCRDR